ncbi:hypothetical protein [Paenibacillus sp. KN14-4R]|uniref:hypothetical protein n=1 Tax=Paenibacillus sp. KN14-4R TaxID=3445773 RepID=UPI003F9F2B9D
MTSLNVSQEEAEQAAKIAISNSVYNEAWKEAIYTLQEKLYDENDQLDAYLFHLILNKSVKGYIIIAGTKDLPPVLEYGEYTNQEFFQKKPDEKLYYLGAFQIISAKNGSDLKQKILSKHQENSMINKDGISPINKNEINENIVFKRLTSSNENISKWSEYLKTKNTTSSFATATTNKVLNVTRLWQRMKGITFYDSACAATTGAMISNYLSNYSVRDSSYYGGDAAFINHLYTEYNSSGFGTSMSGYRTGMVLHLNHEFPGPIFTWTVSSFRGSDSDAWTKYVGRIDNNRPEAIRFDLNSSTTFASYHFVAGIGYDTSNKTVGVKDPDAGQYNTGTQWFSWDANKDYIELTLSKYNGY